MLFFPRFSFPAYAPLTFWMVCGYCTLSLATVSSAGEIEEIAAKLGSVDLSERREAAYTLAEKGEKALPALDELVKALNDKDAQVWFQSITAIGKLGPLASSASNEVAIHLGSDSQQRRYRAAWCLSCFGCDAIQSIKLVLTHDSERSRTAALTALGGMAICRQQAIDLLAQSIGDELNVAKQAIASLVRLEALEELLTALSDDRREVQIAAATGLSTFDQLPTSADSKLIQLARSNDPRVRAAAISAMGASGIESGMLKEIIEDSLSNPDSLISNAIIVLLKKRSNQSDLIDSVCTQLRSDAANIREASAQILGSSVKDSAVVRVALVDALQRSTTDTPEVIKAMTRMGDKMINQLLDYDDSNHQFEERLIEVLATLGSSRVRMLIAALQSDNVVASTRAAGAFAMMERIPQEAILDLVKSLDSPSDSVQLASLRSLQQQDELGASAIKKIQKIANGERLRHRIAAIKLLATADPISEETLRVFDQASREEEGELRLAVLEAITGNKFAENRYADFLEDCLLVEDYAVRKGATNVLAKMDLCPQRFEKKLILLLEDNSLDLRVSALQALSVIELKSQRLSKRIAGMMNDADPKMLVEILQVLASCEKTATQQVTDVQKLLNHPNPSVRAKAIHCLARISQDTNAVISSAITLLADQDWIVRKTAAKQLGEYGSSAKRAVPDLFLMLNSEEDEAAARDALKAIDEVGLNALDVLMGGLDSDDRGIRFYAMYLIGKIGPDAEIAAPKLEAMLKNSDSGRFRETIQQALERIQPEEVAGK